jgi:hypothetical protein
LVAVHIACRPIPKPACCDMIAVRVLTRGGNNGTAGVSSR